MDLLIRWMLNTVYALLLAVMLPVILWRMLRHGRYRQGLTEKLFGRLSVMHDGRPVVWWHAVSVGEVIQLQKVVEEFRRQTGDAFQLVISTSTDTGFELARKRFVDCQVTWFPLDFSWAVRSALSRIRPAMVVLMELELWPTFLAECHAAQVFVAVINARISERSYHGYWRIRSLLHPLFARLSLAAAQSETYAARLVSLGVPESVVHVTGSIKFDGVETDRTNHRTSSLRELFGLTETDVVLVAGSTQDPEESLVLRAWAQLRTQYPAVRLILVPRHQERFDEVARLVTENGFSLLRRSSPDDQAAAESGASGSVSLLDSIGELSACWGLADIAIVGGSFGDRGGQNMIEPAAYGACILFGPNIWNFQDTVDRFCAAGACVWVRSSGELTDALRTLLGAPERRQELGRKAQEVVLQHQGAVQQTALLLCGIVQQHQLDRSADRAA